MRPLATHASNVPHVLFVAAEAVPLAKTGGLGDVITALAAELRMQGVDVSVLMPAYPSAMASASQLKRVARLPDLSGGEARLWRGTIREHDIGVLLLDNPKLYNRPGNPYQDEHGVEFSDNALRFAALSQAAASIATGRTGEPIPHVVHAHDWHAGLTPLFLREARAKSRSVFTIHNLAFQGVYPLALGESLGIAARHMNADGIEFWGQLSFMKAGLLHTDHITTVSHTYAREILTPEFGNGLDGLLRARAADLSAVPNGIDTKVWDPATDTLIAKRFSASDLRGKTACKLELQKRFGLPAEPFAPIVALCSRLTTQKMADVAIEALPALLAEHPRMQVAVLGRGDAGIEAGLRELAQRHPGQIGLIIGYDEEHAHCLQAGADILLHGSRFEPFGLTPIYSMRYGTVPIVSRVGGLADTVKDAGSLEAPVEGATGFAFSGERAEDMLEALQRALAAFTKPELWRGLQLAGMRGEYGWEDSARRYIDLYRELMTSPEEAKVFAPVMEEAAEAVIKKIA